MPAFYYPRVHCYNCGITEDIEILFGTEISQSCCPHCGCKTLGGSKTTPPTEKEKRDVKKG